MKKVLTALTALVLTFGMTACAAKAPPAQTDAAVAIPVEYVSESVETAEETSVTKSEKFGESGDITGFACGYNVLFQAENGEVISAISESMKKPLNINEGLDLTLFINVGFAEDCLGSEYESLAENDGIKADVRLFCNGKVVKHSLDKNEQATEKTTITLTSDGESEIPIYVPPTDIGSADSALLWVCVEFVPDYIPDSGKGEVPLSIMRPAWVSSSGTNEEASVYEAQDSDYVTGNIIAFNGYSTKDLYAVEMGNYDEDLRRLEILAPWDITTVTADSDFAVTAYFKSDRDYYLAVLRDGQPINAFDGKMFMKVNCQGGDRMVKYTLDTDDVSGEHAYSVIALPASKDDALHSTDSKRYLVNIAK